MGKENHFKEFLKLISIIDSPSITSKELLEVLRHPLADHEVLLKVAGSRAVTPEILLEVLRHQLVDNTILEEIVSNRAVTPEIVLEILRNSAFSGKYGIVLFIKLADNLRALTPEVLLEILHSEWLVNDMVLERLARSHAATPQILLEILGNPKLEHEGLMNLARNPVATPEVLLTILRHRDVHNGIFAAMASRHIVIPEILLKILEENKPKQVNLGPSELRSLISSVADKRHRHISKLSSLLYGEQFHQQKDRSQLPYIFNLSTDTINYILTFYLGVMQQEQQQISIVQKNENTDQFKLIVFSDFKKGIEKSIQSILENRPKKPKVRLTNAGEERFIELEKKEVPSDGDCFYHAVLFHLEANQENTVISLRNRVADYIQDQLENYNNQDFRATIEEQLRYYTNINTVDQYVQAIRQPGIIWADNLQIIALMRVLERPIHVVDNHNKLRYIGGMENEIIDDNQPIFVHYNGYNHYSALIIDNHDVEENNRPAQTPKCSLLG